MNCRQAEKLLPEYLDHEINSQLQLKLEDHLRNCSYCQAKQEEMEALFAGLNSLDLLAAPAGFEEDLMTKINLIDNKTNNKSSLKNLLAAKPISKRRLLYGAGMAALSLLAVANMLVAFFLISNSGFNIDWLSFNRYFSPFLAKLSDFYHLTWAFFSAVKTLVVSVYLLIANVNLLYFTWIVAGVLVDIYLIKFLLTFRGHRV